MDSLQWFFSSDRDTPAKFFVYLTVAIGVCKVLEWLWTVLSFVYRQVLRGMCCTGRDRFMRWYGTRGSSWALVTGGSDGIGLSLVQELAEMGFNICIVARNAEKMQGICDDLRKKHPSIQTKSIVCDFSKVCTIAEYREVVADKVRELDLAMVFLNGGTLIPGQCANQSDSQIETVYRMNILHGAYLTKALLP